MVTNSFHSYNFQLHTVMHYVHVDGMYVYCCLKQMTKNLPGSPPGNGGGGGGKSSTGSSISGRAGPSNRVRRWENF